MARTAPRFAVAVPLTLALAACGGGPRHIGDITLAVQERLSGAWTLNAEESDDPQEALDAVRPGESAAGRRPGGGMAPRGGAAGRGGIARAGAGRGGRPAGGRGGSLEAATAVRRVLLASPRHLEISLSDSLVSIGYTTQDVWVLPFGEEVKRDGGGDLAWKAEAEWREGRLVLTRSVSGGGSITETFMPSMDGRKLTVAVESSILAGNEFRRVYDARRGG